jgi:manganese/zinc/iron transport system substrate-binding protein
MKINTAHRCLLLRRKSFQQLVWLALSMGAMVGGCAKAAERALPSPYTIVTTCGMVTDIVREVAGEKAKVTGLMGEGVDPHLYKPTRDDVARLLKADVVFYSGLMLEGRMTDTFLKLSRRGTPVFAVTELLDEKFLLEPPEFAGHTDPHVWMDVSGWIQAVKVVAKSLGEVDGPNTSFYKANADAYIKQLEKLDAYAKQAVNTIPKERRVLITAHDAFNYFGRAYGIDVRGIQGISTESEAGVADINRLVNFLVERRIPAIFVETSVSDKNVRALVEGARSHGHTVRIGGTLFSDAMGAPGTYEGTYIGMIDHNVTTITRALGGEAPERGVNGKLTMKPLPATTGGGAKP